MSLENPLQVEENKFTEKFPHLSHLTPNQQEKFQVLHTHNEMREANDKETEANLLAQLEAPLHTKEKIQKTRSEPRPAEAVRVPSRATKITTNVVDFVPVIGSAKMVAEAIRGKQFGTEKELHGKARFFHGVAGGVFFVLDCTGVGAIASEIGKAGGKIGLEILGKEAVVRLAENTVVKEEGVKLGVRGLERNKKQEKLAAV